MSPDAVSIGLRTLAFAALFQAVGGTIFLLGFGDRLKRTAPAIRRLGRIAAPAGMLLLLAHELVEAARMADGFQGLMDVELQLLAWHSSAGAMHVVQALGLGLLLPVLWRANALTRFSAVVGMIAAIGGFLLAGHTSASPQRWLLAPLLAIHLLVTAFWFGALWPLAMVCRDESPVDALVVLRRFSAVAGVLVPMLAIAGLAMGWTLAGGDATVLRRPYGWLLLAKLSGLLPLLALAAYNRWQLTPALERGAVHARRGLRRTMAVEYLLIVLVFALTATLTTWYSPES